MSTISELKLADLIATPADVEGTSDWLIARMRAPVNRIAGALLEDISRSIAEYEVRSGDRASRIYLGHREVLALKNFVSCAAAQRSEVLGLRVYEVDADEYMQVGP